MDVPERLTGASAKRPSAQAHPPASLKCTHIWPGCMRNQLDSRLPEKRPSGSSVRGSAVVLTLVTMVAVRMTRRWRSQSAPQEKGPVSPEGPLERAFSLRGGRPCSLLDSPSERGAPSCKSRASRIVRACARGSRAARRLESFDAPRTTECATGAIETDGADGTAMDSPKVHSNGPRGYGKAVVAERAPR